MARFDKKQANEAEKVTGKSHSHTHKNALIVFTRNPALRKVKTRLAATVGDQAALDIYTFLLKHTVSITKEVQADVFVFYSEAIREHDLWNNGRFHKRLQQGDDLGARMQHAFEQVLGLGYERAIVIGSDMYDLSTAEIDRAFTALQEADVVIGPAQDGGYYLLGLKKILPELFKNKAWGTDTVLRATLNDLETFDVIRLAEKNDIDYFSDVKDIPALQHLLPGYLDSKF
jgi:rSAM/selenodomain-associated transferase 1